jgi:hypothetical protein
MKTMKAMLGALTLLVATSAFAQSMDNQPKIPHAFYGRDGFWHCEPGYRAGETGACEPLQENWRYSTFTRLRKAASEDDGRSMVTEQ